MGPALLLGIALIFTLSGCLEGNRQYSRYQDQDSYPNIFDSSDWTLPTNGSDFISPLGHPANGDFSGAVKRTFVASESELVSAIENQSEPMVVIIIGDIALTKPVQVKFPLLIETTKELGVSNSSLQFLTSVGGISTGGELVVDAVQRKIQNLSCSSKIDETLETQTFLKLKGNISHPKVALKSNTHFVADLDSSFEKVIKISNQDMRSTVVLVGDSKLELSNSVGRIVFRYRNRSSILYDTFHSDLPTAALRFLYIDSGFYLFDSTSPTSIPLPGSDTWLYYIKTANHCMNKSMLKHAFQMGLSGFTSQTQSIAEQLGTGHKANCEAAGWGDEVRQRRSCSTSVTKEASAMSEGGVQ